MRLLWFVINNSCYSLPIKEWPVVMSWFVGMRNVTKLALAEGKLAYRQVP